MQLFGPGRVDDEPIRPIAHDHWQNALQRPERQLGQTLGLSSTVTIADDQIRRQGFCFGDICTDAHAKPFDIECGASPGGDASPDFLLRRSLAPSEGRSRRPASSHAFTQESALSPARHWMSSTRQRDRQRPGAGKIRDSRTETLQRLTLAVGCPKSPTSVCRPHPPQSQADGVGSIGANCWPREAVIEKRAVSATTAPSPS